MSTVVQTAATALEHLLDRRALLKRAGALVAAVSVSGNISVVSAQTPDAESGPAPLDPTQLDSFIAITTDGRVTAFFGKMDMGQGTDTGIAQFVADEIDVAFEKVTVISGDTALTVDQGGASNASGIQQGSWPLRNAAAEARRVLLEMAAVELSTPVDRLTVDDGVITIIDDATSSITYGELIGNQKFNIQLEWNESYGNGLNVVGQAEVKTADQFKVVRQRIERTDIRGKIFAEYTFIDKVTVPGMLHGRVLRPPVAGSIPTGFDASSVADIPNVQVVHRDGFIGVVAPDEWHAIKASWALAVDWSEVEPSFIPMNSLYDYLRETPARNTEPGVVANLPTDEGDVDEAFEHADRVIEAEYEWPFQSHACLGPACAVADVTPDSVTVWTGTQKPHRVQAGVADVLGRELSTVRAIWVHGPGSYGRNDADDAAADAAILSEAVGAPVRLQYMRSDATGWDPKGPAAVITCKAAIDAEGTVTAYSFYAKGFSGQDVGTSGDRSGDLLAGMLLGHERAGNDTFGTPAESYGFANKRAGWDVVEPFLFQASPLRTAHIRDPQGPQTTFSSESFIDELAFELGQDPVEFRLQYLTNPRHVAAVTQVAEAAGWESRPSPNPVQDDPDVLTGRGIAYAQRGQTVVAIVAEVEVNRETGRVWVRKFTVSHDCGLVVNPRSLENTIEGAVLQATSRTLYEEVQFDESNVTSFDWASYPILDITDAPDEFEIVIIENPDDPPLGAGEPATKPVSAAIANAIFDATGVRLRRAPFRPERGKAAMVGHASLNPGPKSTGERLPGRSPVVC